MFQLCALDLAKDPLSKQVDDKGAVEFLGTFFLEPKYNL